MNPQDRPESVPCADVALLIPFAANGTIGDAERGIVERHMASCAVCAAAHRFAVDLRTGMRAAALHEHVDPARLVAFAEDPSGVEDSERMMIEAHLHQCDGCAAEHAVLLRVEDADQGDARADVPRPAARAQASRVSDAVERIVNRLREAAWTALSPAPAMAYLVVAVLATGLLLLRPAWLVTGKPGDPGTAVSEAPWRVGGGVLLTDDRAVYRGGTAPQPDIPEVDAGDDRVLILELTDLPAAPAQEDVYRLRIVASGESRPVWERTVTGSLFARDYTLCLPASSLGLEPGAYVIEALDPSGREVFRAAFRVVPPSRG